MEAMATLNEYRSRVKGLANAYCRDEFEREVLAEALDGFPAAKMERICQRVFDRRHPVKED